PVSLGGPKPVTMGCPVNRRSATVVVPLRLSDSTSTRLASAQLMQSVTNDGWSASTVTTVPARVEVNSLDRCATGAVAGSPRKSTVAASSLLSAIDGFGVAATLCGTSWEAGGTAAWAPSEGVTRSAPLSATSAS